MVRIPIPEYLSLALSIEYVVIIHKESKEIIYYKTAGDFDPDFLDIFRSSIQYELLSLPLEENTIEQATLEGKYLITHTGKMIWTTLITKNKPVITARESLVSFSSRFEKLYNEELRELYSEFNGDISIFQRKSLYKVSVDMIADDEFKLRLTLPYKLVSKKGKDITPKIKDILQLAKDIANKNKGRIFLNKLLIKAGQTLEVDNLETTLLIYDLVENEILIPIPLEDIKKKFATYS